MPPNSKSKLNGGRSKMVPKPKQIWRVKQPTRNWLELPSDLMLNILQRVGVFDRLENAQKVCTAWREICKDPAMWRVVCMDIYSGEFQDMCKHVVDRSQGQLVDLTINGFCDNDLLQYVVDRSSQLRCLEIVHDCFEFFEESWSEALKKISLLEELSLVETDISQKDIEVLGHYCPLLKTLKLNQKVDRFWGWGGSDDDEESMTIQNELALAIGKNLPELTHLELIGNNMTNTGLQAILDGCCHLQSLDMRGCLCVDLKGDLGKRCSQQINNLKLPHDSLEGCPHSCDSEFVSGDGYLDYDGYSYYDDYTAYNNDIDNLSFESLGEMMAFMALFE